MQVEYCWMLRYTEWTTQHNNTYARMKHCTYTCILCEYTLDLKITSAPIVGIRILECLWRGLEQPCYELIRETPR